MALTPEQRVNAKHQAEVEHARFARRADLAIKDELTEAFVLKQWRDIATADISELMQYRRGCCRHCYGIGHAYQWTPEELQLALEAGNTPNCSGGTDYDPIRPPARGCPRCKGEGDGREMAFFADTRNLSEAGRKVFAGVKSTKNGIEIKTRDQDAALNNIAKYLGMLIDRKELTGANGGPLAVVGMTPADLSDEQLAALIAGSEGSAEPAEAQPSAE